MQIMNPNAVSPHWKDGDKRELSDEGDKKWCKRATSSPVVGKRITSKTRKQKNDGYAYYLEIPEQRA